MLTILTPDSKVTLSIFVFFHFLTEWTPPWMNDTEPAMSFMTRIVMSAMKMGVSTLEFVVSVQTVISSCALTATVPTDDS